ncbi:MAG: ABC transporter substrate-binding protein [Gemmatimonadetes bacterium]|nr:ABC transporter substrate-binding protein [Gemmatimonadota bacterium]
MKLVSLCPSLTELVFDLGVGDAVVGRTKFCVHPQGRVEVVERVGGTKNPKVDRIIALAPDLVLMNEEENRVEDAEVLRAAGLKVHSSMPRTVAETSAMVREIAALVGAEERGNALAAVIDAEGARVAAATEGERPIRYAYLIWWEPLMAAGGGTFIEGILAAAGGVNVFATGAERYPTVSSEALAPEAVDAVLLSSEPFPFTTRHLDALADATKIPRRRFRLVDGELLSWHGSRTVAGLRYAGELMASLRAD